MKEDIYEPLARYRDEFKEKFAGIAERTFQKLSAASCTDADIAQNRQIVAHINSVNNEKSELESHRGCLSFFRFILKASATVSAVVLVYHFIAPAVFRELRDSGPKVEQSYLIIAGIVLVVSLLLVIFALSPRISVLNSEISGLRRSVEKLKETAWSQMEKLNALFTWDLLPEMITECIANIEFDPYFCCGRLDDLNESFGWCNIFNNDSSILFAHSGSINGNPFIVCKFRRQMWESVVYTGTKVITYTETVRDSNGKLRKEVRFQTLVATVTKMKPEYVDKSAVIYGNEAAPKLTFSRDPSEYSGEDGFFSNLGKKSELKKLEKFARNLEDDSDFTMMSNKEFEVLYHADDRDDEVQFRVLFTPLAQQQMVNLLNDKEYGYGDDFSFIKNRKINIIHSGHLDSTDIDTNPEQFKNYSYDDIKDFFIARSNEYFRAIYFAFAPLLTIPLYQQPRSFHSIYGDMDRKNISFWEVESFVNYMGASRFKHPKSATKNILKATDCRILSDGKAEVTAYGFQKIKHVEFVPVYGKDGNWHNVPVEWFEYIPVSRTSTVNIGITDKNTAALDTRKIRRQLYICR